MAGEFGVSETRLRLWESFLRISTSIPNRLDGRLQADTGTPLSSFLILFALARADEESMRMSELAAAINSSPSRLSHTIQRLESQGWVRRERSTSDRRGNLAVLTADGMSALVAGLPATMSFIDEIFDLFNEEQTRILDQILETVEDGLTNGLVVPPKPSDDPSA